MNTRKPVLLLVLSLIVAAGCVRLGLWQLSRLSQRRARNTVARAGLAAPAVDLSSAPADSVARFRAVRAHGVFDFSREVALSGRPRDGAPGADIATPLLLAEHDAAVLVVRGWVYSPDAASVDFARWHERDSAVVEGYALPFDPDAPAPIAPSDSSRAVRRLDHAQLEHRLGIRLAPFYLVMTSGVRPGDSVPQRLGPPVLDEGPHMSYAIQWFFFAAIFGVGGTVVVLRANRRSSAVD
ncbi:MAG TPA: SURF1 family protein [Gemmatimonadaceae bacterium]|nr:SURF1 family protein [Gemmatimonadaceae bacterium]